MENLLSSVRPSVRPFVRSFFRSFRLRFLDENEVRLLFIILHPSSIKLPLSFSPIDSPQCSRPVRLFLEVFTHSLTHCSQYQSAPHFDAFRSPRRLRPLLPPAALLVSRHGRGKHLEPFPLLPLVFEEMLRMTRFVVTDASACFKPGQKSMEVKNNTITVALSYGWSRKRCHTARLSHRLARGFST